MHQHRTLLVEQLEDRRLLSAGSVEFCDDFSNGSLDGWTTIENHNGNGIVEAGGELRADSGDWALAPAAADVAWDGEAVSGLLTQEYVLTTKIDFNGTQWNEIYTRSSGAGGSRHGSPDGIRFSYWSARNGIDVSHSAGGDWVDLSPSQTGAIVGFDAHNKSYVFEIDDQIDSITATMYEAGNPNNRVTSTISNAANLGFGGRFAIGVDPGPPGWGTSQIAYDDFQVDKGDSLPVIISESLRQTIVNENDATYNVDTYTVVLGSQPTSNVTVTAAPSNNEIELNEEGAGNFLDLTFTSTNWDDPQTVTVKAIADVTAKEGVQSTMIVHTSSSADAAFQNVAIPDVTATVVDAANAYLPADFNVYGKTGFTDYSLEKVTHFASGSITYANDGTLAAAPAETASFVDRIHRFGVKVFANFHNEVVPEGSSFDLVTDNADGSRDNFVSNIQQYVVAHNYDGVWFNVEWSDQLPPWVGHNQIMGELDNALGGSYEILSDVFIHRGELGAVGLPHVDAITMMSYNSFGEAITFPDYWTNRGAANDQLTMGMSTGWNSFGLNPADAYNRVVYALNNNMTGVFLFGFDSEDDATSMLRGVRDALFDNAPAASVTITQTGGSPTVNENGPTSVGYQIVLGTAPTSTVTITVDPDGETEVNGEGAGNVATLTFNSFDWNIAHWVFVRAVVDADVEVNPHLSIIRHTASSADPDYSGIGIANVLVNVLDLGPLTPGDANGDGSVNGLDFGVWETNQFTTDTVWSTGDFNHDGVTDIRAFNMWNANKFLVSALAGSDEAAGQAASRQPRAALSAPSPNRLSVGIAAVAGQSQLGIDRRLAERIEKFQHGAEASVVHSWEPLDRLWTLFDPWQDGLDRDRARWKIGGQVEVDESVTDEVFARRTASIPLFQTA
jgi:hypothetical protein